MSLLYYITGYLSFTVAKVVCVGSIAELKELSGVEITDLHREK